MTHNWGTVFVCVSIVLQFVTSGLATCVYYNTPLLGYRLEGLIQPYWRVAMPISILWAITLAYASIAMKILPTLTSQLFLVGSGFFAASIGGTVLLCGSLHFYNVWADKGECVTHRAIIQEKITQIKGIKGYNDLVLPHPYNSARTISIRVRKKLFEAVKVGDEIVVTTCPGRLGAEWIDDVEKAEKVSFTS